MNYLNDKFLLMNQKPGIWLFVKKFNRPGGFQFKITLLQIMK